MHPPEHLESFGRVVVVGGQVQLLSVVPVGRAHARAAQTHRARHDAVEDGLNIGRRARDDPQDLARGGLLFEGLGQGAVATLQFVEQPDVLDGDHRLIGEGLEQRDLLVGEGSGRPRWTMIAPIGTPVPQHRHARARCAGRTRHAAPRGLYSASRLHVGDVHDGAPQDRARRSHARGWPASDRARRTPRPAPASNRAGHRVASSRRRSGRRADTAAQSRRALRAIVSNTGWTSVGELLITRRISAVAVCCSSVSVSSWFFASSSRKSRTFSMAITAWSAKVWRRATCASGNAPATAGGRRSRRSGAVPEHGDGQHASEAQPRRVLANSGMRRLGHIREMNGRALQDRAASHRPASGSSGMLALPRRCRSRSEFAWATKCSRSPS